MTNIFKKNLIIILGLFAQSTFTGSLNDLVADEISPYTFGSTGVTIDEFVYQVMDSNTGCDSVTGNVSIDISSLIISPTGFSACMNTPIITGSLNGQVNSDFLPYVFETGSHVVGGKLILNVDGTYTFYPTPGFTGAASFDYFVVDNNGCTGSGLVQINISSPTIASSGISLCTNIPASGSLAGQVSGGTLPYTFGPTGTAAYGVVDVQPNASYVFTPTPGFVGQASFDYQVIDGDGCIATGSLSIDYGTPIASAGMVSICENSPLLGGSFIATGGMPPYNFTIVTNGTLGMATITDAVNGTFNYISNPDTFGIDEFIFQVTDANGCVSNSAVFQVAIIQAPITSVAQVTGCANTQLSGNLNSFVAAGAPPYSFTGNGVPLDGLVTIDPTGSYIFAPFIGFAGLGGFGYLVTDSAGCSATGIVDINILSPIASSTVVNACYQILISGDLSSLVISEFPPYAFELDGLPVGGDASVGANGIYNFSPAIGFSGPGGFNYQVTDSNNCSATASVTINVDSLVGTNASLITCSDNFIGTLVDFVTGGTGALIFTGPLSVNCGSVIIESNGDFVYAGSAGFTGTYDFVYQVSDGIGCNSTGVISITTNVAPVVNESAIATCQGVAISDSLAPLLNDGPRPPLTFIIVTGPNSGHITSFNATTGAYTYMPNVGFSGIDSFQFQVVDSTMPPCTTNIGTVTIMVNQAPVANGETNSACINKTISESIVDSISGGTPPYTFAQIGAAVNGTVTLNPDGSYMFAPTPKFIGLGTFKYQVTDANGCISNIATCTIDIIRCPLTNNPFMQLVNAQYPR